jgi:hypothetical protein
MRAVYPSIVLAVAFVSGGIPRGNPRRCRENQLRTDRLRFVRTEATINALPDYTLGWGRSYNDMLLLVLSCMLEQAYRR